MPINQYRIIWDLMHTIDRDNTIITHDFGQPARAAPSDVGGDRRPARTSAGASRPSSATGSASSWARSWRAPDKLCINVMGDSAIGMTGMDIETAARNNIGTLTVVFNNGVMAAERDVLKVLDPRSTAR